MGMERGRNMTTSDYLGQSGGTYEGYTRKVKDIILKASIEEAKRRDALQIEAFGGHLDERTEV